MEEVALAGNNEVFQEIRVDLSFLDGRNWQDCFYYKTFW
jgi:hypothetical protein